METKENVVKESKGKKVGKVVKSIEKGTLKLTGYATLYFVCGVAFRVGCEVAEDYLKNKNN